MVPSLSEICHLKPAIILHFTSPSSGKRVIPLNVKMTLPVLVLFMVKCGRLRC